MQSHHAQSHDLFELVIDPRKEGAQSVSARPSQAAGGHAWHASHQEGQLAIDVAQTEHEIVVVSTMAGADLSSIDVFVQQDLLTIRGARRSPLESKDVSYVYQECYWGAFSRTVVLPTHVNGASAMAEYQSGVLVVTVPKGEHRRQVPITVIDE